MLNKRRLALLCAIAVSPAVAITAEKAPARQSAFPLTVDSIMRGPKLVGYPPSDLRWSGDSKELFFEWRMPDEDEAATWVVSRDGGEPQRLTDEERRTAPPPPNVPSPRNGTWDRSQRRMLAVQDGDIVLIDTVARTRRLLTRTTTRESSPRWARNETHVTFVRENSVFVVPVDASDGGLLVQLVDVGPKRPDPQPNDSQKFVKDEELTLLEAVKEAAARRKKREERDKAQALPKFELQERQSVTDAALGADEVLYLLVTERTDRAKAAIVPNYVTESAYTEDINARTKVGDPQDKPRLAVFDVKSAKTAWAKVPGLDEKRELRWSIPVLSDDGRHGVASARSADNEDRWFVLVARDGTGTIVDHSHDEAWIRDPGFTGWLDNRRFWFGAEKDGWAHLYSVDVTADKPAAKALTSGRWEITDAEISADRTTFYISTTEVHPAERHLYSVPVDGGPRTKLTTMAGATSGSPSPDGSTLGVIYSYVNKPPEVYLMANQPGAAAKQVTTSTSAEWRGGRWLEAELVTFKARDGVDVPARLYTPEMLGARRDRHAPGVIFVHGAGYLQNAHRYWSSYYREYMFHHLLASRGYVVLDVDYRGSAGYGRDWRTAIYRHMGGKDLDDIVDGARYLVDKQKVNPRRLGVYGGSYGGFITLMAMFTSPKTFAAGAALRPVTDWAHYNHPYTANILNEPHSDQEAYRKSSPIYFADRLEGALLILHGMVDVNVHFQDSVRLAQRLIELRKENWELAAYPVEDHGFVRETSWADEYKRILKLFDLHLRGVAPASDARTQTD